MKTVLVNLFLFLSFGAQTQNFYEEAEIKKLYQKLKNSDENSKVSLQNNIAILLSDLNLLDSSYNLSENALKLAKKLALNNEIASAEINIGKILQKRGAYFEASNHFENAIKFAKNDSTLAKGYFYLGSVYYSQKLLDKCLEANNKALKIIKGKKYWSTEAFIINAIGLIYIAQKENYSKVLPNGFKGLELAKKAKDTNLIAVFHKNIGRFYLLNQFHHLNLDENIGLQHVNLAIKLQQESNKKVVYQNIVFSYFVLVEHYIAKGQYELANEYAYKALEVAEKAQWIDEMADCEDFLYNNYKALGNFKESLVHFEKFRIYNEQLNEDKLASQRAIVDQKLLNAGLESENNTRINQRNWLLIFLLASIIIAYIIYRFYKTVKSKNTIIEQINNTLEEKVSQRTAELQQSLNETKQAMFKGQTTERKRVAAELHDNLGSLLSAVQISLDVVDATKLSADEQTIFGNVQNQIQDAYREVRLLSHNLQPAELEKEGLQKALARLSQKINLTGKLKLSVDFLDFQTLSKEIEFNLYSICLELINNTLKHSEATEASITFTKNAKNQQIMTVKDNGKGINISNNKGFGLENIEQRLQQIGGELTVKNDNGSVFEIKILYS